MTPPDCYNGILLNFYIIFRPHYLLAASDKRFSSIYPFLFPFSTLAGFCLKNFINFKSVIPGRIMPWQRKLKGRCLRSLREPAGAKPSGMARIACVALVARRLVCPGVVENATILTGTCHGDAAYKQLDKNIIKFDLFSSPVF